MKYIAAVLVCCVSVLLQPTRLADCMSFSAIAQNQDHGGKIETKYDGFNHETLMTLNKMRVTCSGFKDSFKDGCVSITVTLHCPGLQPEHVRYVTLDVIFDTKSWDRWHQPDQRDLSVVAGTDTLRLGRMNLLDRDVSMLMTETLQARLSYDAFKKIAQSSYAEVQVGPSRFELREKNLMALRDLNNRILK
ncbi:MAG: hypothetical protein ABR555_17330 [Pyrinomonadaceae bacterium]